MAPVRNPVFALAALLAAAGVIGLAGPPAAGAAGNACERWGEVGAANLRPAQARKAVLCLVNRRRRVAGVRALSRSGKLQRVAQRHTARMVRSRCFSHECPGEGDLGARLKRAGYLIGGLERWAYGENIAYGGGRLGTPEAIVRAWMDSPPHRATMLGPAFREAGVGVAVRGGIAFYTLDLGLRRR